MSTLLEVEFIRRRERLLPSRACVLIIDVQERLAAAMPPAVLEQIVKNTQILITTAQTFMMPIVVSQQYPKGLGQTVSALASSLETAQANGVDVYRFDKTDFSCVDAPEFGELPPAAKIGALMAREQWLVAGMETHVCVYQTVRDLCGPACAVHVVADAVASRTKANWRAGLDLCRSVGAMVTTTETIALDLTRKAGSDQFKAISKAIK
ncbi:MAG TPA: isochorismatase family protein [Kofleriaceae bacterium]|jgi:nicotinamidase-related amidase